MPTGNSQAAPGDPWDWDIEMTLRALRDSKLLPDRTLELFRENEMSGRAMLTVVDLKTLKEDIGIKPLGQRELVMRLVLTWRGLSQKYQQSLRDAHEPLEMELPGIRPMFMDQPLERAPLNLLMRGEAQQPLLLTTPIKEGQEHYWANGRKHAWNPPEIPSTEDQGFNAEETQEDDEDGNLIEEDSQPLDPLEDALQREIMNMDNTDHNNRRSTTPPCTMTPSPSPVSAVEFQLEDAPEIEPEERVTKRRRIEPTLIHSDDTVTEDEAPPPQRRRLDPTLLQQIEPADLDTEREGTIPSEEKLQDEDVVMENGVEPDQGEEAHTENEHAPSGGPQRKRIKPTLISPLEGTEESDTEVQTTIPVDAPKDVAPRWKQRRSKYRYLEPRAMPINKVLYSEDMLGGDLELEAPETFCHVNTVANPGIRQYVYRWVKHCLLGKNRTEYQGHTTIGTIRMAFRYSKPVDLGLLTAHEPETVMVIDYDSETNTISSYLADDRQHKFPWGKPDFSVVLRHNPPPLNILVTVGASGNTHGYDDWDYLEKWKDMEDDRVLPVYGDSDSDEVDEVYEREVAKEIAQREKKTRPRRDKSKPLRPEEVHLLVEQGEKLIRENWHLVELPKWERRAYRIWNAAASTKTRKQKKTEARNRIDELTANIRKLREAIVSEVWISENAVLRQCKSLELSIYDQEYNKWFIDLLCLTQQPDLPPKLKRKREPKPIPLGEDSDVDSGGEEEIGSEDSEMDDDDESDMEGFVVSDNEFDLDADGNPIIVGGDFSGPHSDMDLDSDSEVELPTAPKKNPPSKSSNTNPTPRPSSPKIKQRVSPEPESAAAIHSSAKKAKKGVFSMKGGVIDLTVSDSETTSGPSTAAGPLKSKETPMLKRKAKSSLTPSIKRSSSSVSLETLLKNKNREGLFDYFVSKLPSKMMARIRTRLESVDVKGLYNRTMLYYTTLVVSVKGKKPKTPKISEEPTSDEKVDRTMANIYAKVVLCCGKDVTELNQEEKNKLNGLTGFIDFIKALKDKVADYTDHRVDESDGELQVVEYQHKDGQKKDNAAKAKRQKTPEPVKKKKKKKKSSGGRQMREDTYEWDEDINTPSRRRVARNYTEDSSALQQREQAHKADENRIRRQRDREKKMQEKGLNVGMRTLINTGHYLKYADVFLPERLDKIVKEHQIDGIKFLWAQLIANSESGDQTGALLSHTMGLGKTCQVIVFLNILAEAGNSDDPKVIGQVPRRLRGRPHVLILSPPGLVENWRDEFRKWAPKIHGEPEYGPLGAPAVLLAASNRVVPEKERLQILDKWSANGGILIMGYSMFRTLLGNSRKKVNEDNVEQIRKILLEKTDLVVADEAHEMKNEKSKLHGFTAGFKTKARIAMTGSPLSNSLKEYYNMIDWIHPGYLGQWREFDAKYVVPITNGLYVDSTASERKQSFKTLQVLNQDVGPKVHRRDITAIKGFLPQKKEFLLSVPLTPLQEKLYLMFLELTRHVRESGSSSFSLFDFISTLQFLCNHPRVFIDVIKLREAEKGKKMAAQEMMGIQPAQSNAPPSPKSPDGAADQSIIEELADDEEGGLEAPEADDPVQSIDLDEVKGLLEEAEKIIADVPNISAEEHSARIQLLRVILTETVKDKDSKVLIFTHWLKTLNYLEECMKRWGISYMRLDGSVSTGSRQKLCKDFNKGDVKAMLVSTRAGGLGLNLPGADRVVIFDSGWTPQTEEQAIGRAYRLGQERPVFVYRFMAGGTFEAKRRNKTEFKLQLSTKVVDRKDRARVSLRTNKQYQAPPTDPPQQDLAPFVGKDRVLDALLKSPEAKLVRSIEETDTFEDESYELTDEDKQEMQRMLEEAQATRDAGIQVVLPSVRKGPKPRDSLGGPATTGAPTAPADQNATPKKDTEMKDAPASVPSKKPPAIQTKPFSTPQNGRRATPPTPKTPEETFRVPPHLRNSVAGTADVVVID